MAMRRTASGLLIPVRMNEEARFTCNIPGCDWRGYTHTEQVIHVKEHIREDEADIMEMTTPFAEKVMGEGADPEYQRYLEDRYQKLLPDVGPKEALDPKRY
jgi:hypothetical protein